MGLMIDLDWPILSLLRLLGHQDWIRGGVRDRVLRTFCNPDTVNSFDFEVNFFGLKYKGNLSCYLDWVVYFYGAYEKQEFFMLRDLVQHKENPIFIDIGANVGQHSLFMSQYCKQVHAFEPYEPVRMLLEEKIKHNSVNNIFVHNVGIGERKDELDFFAPKGANKGTGSFVSSHAIGNNEYIGKLKVVNGDNYFAKMGLKKIDLIKIDVEGFEKSVLKGLADTLHKCRPTVVMEFSDTTKLSFTRENELKSMLPEGYTIKRVICDRPYCAFFNRTKCRYADFNFNDPASGNLLFVGEWNSIVKLK